MNRKQLESALDDAALAWFTATTANDRAAHDQTAFELLAAWEEKAGLNPAKYQRTCSIARVAAVCEVDVSCFAPLAPSYAAKSPAKVATDPVVTASVKQHKRVGKIAQPIRETVAVSRKIAQESGTDTMRAACDALAAGLYVAMTDGAKDADIRAALALAVDGILAERTRITARPQGAMDPGAQLLAMMRGKVQGADFQSAERLVASMRATRK